MAILCISTVEGSARQKRLAQIFLVFRKEFKPTFIFHFPLILLSFCFCRPVDLSSLFGNFLKSVKREKEREDAGKSKTIDDQFAGAIGVGEAIVEDHQS